MMDVLLPGRLIFAALLVASTACCRSGAGSRGSDGGTSDHGTAAGDGGGDTDSGSDSDTESDPDIDSDSESDSDTDADTDSDSGDPGDGGTDADGGSDTGEPCSGSLLFSVETRDEGGVSATTFSAGDKVRLVGIIRNLCDSVLYHSNGTDCLMEEVGVAGPSGDSSRECMSDGSTVFEIPPGSRIDEDVSLGAFTAVGAYTVWAAFGDTPDDPVRTGFDVE